jgi:hypothetical protein
MTAEQAPWEGRQCFSGGGMDGVRSISRGVSRAIWIWISALLLALSMTAPAAAQDAPLARAGQLMREGKPAEAYAVLEPLESANAGDVRFDYALGTAALDSGHPDRATIAFERVLAINPNFAGARLDLARAYFAMGSDDLAKNELDTVLQADPPEQVRQVVARYMAAIEERKKRGGATFLGYVEGNAGYDSNISAVTGNFTGGVLQAYNIPNVQPTGNSIHRRGLFSGYALGADYSRPFESVPELAWYLGGDARERHYYNDNENPAFDSQQFDTRGGLAYTFDGNLFKAGLQAQRYYQEGAAPLGADGTRTTNDRRSFGYTLEWRHVLAPGRQFAAFAQFNEQRFLTNNIQDINQNLYGAQLINAFQTRWNPLALLMAFQSRDRALRPLNAAGTASVSKTLTGVRAYGQVTPWENWDVFLTAGQTERRDDAMFARSLVIGYGVDRTFDVAAGVNWRFLPAWSGRAQVSTTENKSNISLYEYTRTELLFTVRREFK